MYVLYALRIEHLKFLLAPHTVALLYWIEGGGAVGVCWPEIKVTTLHTNIVDTAYMQRCWH